MSSGVKRYRPSIDMPGHMVEGYGVGQAYVLASDYEKLVSMMKVLVHRVDLCDAGHPESRRRLIDEALSLLGGGEKEGGGV